MDEEISIIDNSTRNEKIKNFFINNKKNLIIGVSAFIIGLSGYFTFDEIKDRKKIKIANQFNLIIINYKEEIEQKTKRDLIDVVNQNDPTYSPLALYFLLDNDLIKNDI